MGTGSSRMSEITDSKKESVGNKRNNDSPVCTESDEYFEYNCDPCSTAGEHAEAKGFCVDCDEYLCANCYRAHSISRTSMYHALLDKDNMPKNSVKTCDPCKATRDNVEAAGYCLHCGDYLCSNCFKSHSRNKTSSQHALLNKDNLPKLRDTGYLSSVASPRVREENCRHEAYTFLRDIDVKAVEDSRDCYITAIALVSNTELVLGDFFNQSLKLVDIENEVVTGTLRLHSPPSGITAISKNQIAVVLGFENKIRLISTSGELKVTNSFKTSANCLDIAYANNRLYVSFKHPVKFQIFQLSGKVCKTIKPSRAVLKHCSFPRYFSVSTDTSLFYVSDYFNKKVMCLDMDGNMISMYEFESETLSDIATCPSGFVYLCNSDRDAIYKLTSDLNDVTEVLGRGDGLFNPQAMCFDAKREHLFVSSGCDEAEHCNFVKVYLGWQRKPGQRIHMVT